jgi:hypothetical protein
MLFMLWENGLLPSKLPPRDGDSDWAGTAAGAVLSIHPGTDGVE